MQPMNFVNELPNLTKLIDKRMPQNTTHTMILNNTKEAFLKN